MTPVKLARAEALMAAGHTPREGAGRLKVGKTGLYATLAKRKAAAHRVPS